MAKTLYTNTQVAEWHSWYLATPRATHQDVADHFGVSYSTVRSQFQRHGFAKRSGNSGDDYAVDPFGAAAADIRAACERALVHQGSMSNVEYDRLQALLAAAKVAIA